MRHTDSLKRVSVKRFGSGMFFFGCDLAEVIEAESGNVSRERDTKLG